LARRTQETKGVAERFKEELHALYAVQQALRHTGVSTRVANLRVQQEPFNARLSRAESFANGTRFDKKRLWHVELEFESPVRGPLVIGDGRYLGLGLMAPVRRAEGVWAFRIERGRFQHLDPEILTRALRRAVMARVQETLGEGKSLPLYFTGHETDGAPSRCGLHAHIAFIADLPRKRLLVIAPHVLERRAVHRNEHEHSLTLDEALIGLRQLRVAREILTLVYLPVDVQHDPLFVPARRWQSCTPYRPTRHAKGVSAEQALRMDVRVELQRRNAPLPDQIEILEVREGRRGGIFGLARLAFKVAVPGPLVLGRRLHFGGGLFAAIG
ncbi:MAG: type I-U CRISPR-associated protein Csb2, partial [Steroidobacteraceae bacterium]|nr:type I-U CRISPR-associated protein Csb2 [Steroidobacteraceae bacterium]